MSKISYVSGTLHRISDQLSEATGKRGTHGESDALSEQTSANVPLESSMLLKSESVLNSDSVAPYLKARYEEMIRLRRDMISKITAHLCRFSSEAAILSNRKQDLEEAVAKLESLLKELDCTPLPELNDAQGKSAVANTLRLFENIRMEDIRIASKLEGSSVASQVSSVEGPHSGGMLSGLTNGELFKKGFFLFLPLLLILLLSALLLSAAFFVAWKIAF